MKQNTKHSSIFKFAGAVCIFLISTIFFTFLNFQSKFTEINQKPKKEDKIIFNNGKITQSDKNEQSVEGSLNSQNEPNENESNNISPISQEAINLVFQKESELKNRMEDLENILKKVCSSESKNNSKIENLFSEKKTNIVCSIKDFKKEKIEISLTRIKEKNEIEAQSEEMQVFSKEAFKFFTQNVESCLRDIKKISDEMKKIPPSKTKLQQKNLPHSLEKVEKIEEIKEEITKTTIEEKNSKEKEERTNFLQKIPLAFESFILFLRKIITLILDLI